MSECAQRLNLDEYIANELSAIIELPVSSRNQFFGLKRLVAQIDQTHDPIVKSSQKLHDLQLYILQKKTIFEEKVERHRETLRGSIQLLIVTLVLFILIALYYGIYFYLNQERPWWIEQLLSGSVSLIIFCGFYSYLFYPRPLETISEQLERVKKLHRNFKFSSGSLNDRFEEVDKEVDCLASIYSESVITENKLLAVGAVILLLISEYLFIRFWISVYLTVNSTNLNLEPLNCIFFSITGFFVGPFWYFLVERFLIINKVKFNIAMPEKLGEEDTSEADIISQLYNLTGESSNTRPTLYRLENVLERLQSSPQTGEKLSDDVEKLNRIECEILEKRAYYEGMQKFQKESYYFTRNLLMAVGGLMIPVVSIFIVASFMEKELPFMIRGLLSETTFIPVVAFIIYHIYTNKPRLPSGIQNEKIRHKTAEKMTSTEFTKRQLKLAYILSDCTGSMRRQILELRNQEMVMILATLLLVLIYSFIVSNSSFGLFNGYLMFVSACAIISYFRLDKTVI
ncbi:hypothetical protein CRE_13259 [Caenorhabditis remanei]|uniref:Uncharacterized protein n=1 Tax=Caenorhabditis remanei TaxID=31234 RepID=E3M8C9_CAERE|nr:hypothetical protein CRE_13259 [Caenorhabditis remanei]